MARYFPIDPGIRFDASKSDLLRIDWGTNHLTADFILPNDETRSLRVSFEVMTIVRLLDEMALSIEGIPEDNDGLVPDHFSYCVEGSAFAETQSAGWKEIAEPLSHYQFVTGWACMDVLSTDAPKFEIVPTDMAAFDAYQARLASLQNELR